MGLIINSGQARSGLWRAEAGEAGRLCRSESDDGAVAPALSEAHRVQTQLIESDEGEGKMKVSPVLVHARTI